jgi:hypothetical protein
LSLARSDRFRPGTAAFERKHEADVAAFGRERRVEYDTIVVVDLIAVSLKARGRGGDRMIAETDWSWSSVEIGVRVRLVHTRSFGLAETTGLSDWTQQRFMRAGSAGLRRLERLVWATRGAVTVRGTLGPVLSG